MATNFARVRHEAPVAAGAQAIYQVARVFRLDELGPLHNPEFTMVEWYRPGDGMNEGMQLTSDLCETLLEHAAGRAHPMRRRRSRGYGRHGPHDSYDGEALLGRPHGPAKRAAIGVPPASLATDDRDGWLDLLMVERIQPHLGQERPALLFDYPASQAALARIRPGNPPVAERFELYVAGIDGQRLPRAARSGRIAGRNARSTPSGVAEGKPALPEESRLLAAMEAGLPPAVGVALGFDRLVMLAAGAKSIAEVVAFPFDRA